MNGIGSGMFAAPNSSSIMGSVPASQRGAASGMRSTFQNSGTALSIGVFFSVMIAGLASRLPVTLASGLRQQGVAPGVAHQIAALPPVSSLFAAVLGVNPLGHLLAARGGLAGLPAAARQTLTGREFFPDLISGPFQHGLVIVFALAAVLSVLAALASALSGARPAPAQPAGTQPAGTQPAGSADRKARGQAPGLPAGLTRRFRRTGDQRRLPAGRLGGVPGAPGQRGVPGGVRRGDQQAAEHG